MDSAFISVDTPVNPKEPLKKVISINGEMVDASDIENVNIHDFTTFEQEELLTGQLIKRRKTFPLTSGKIELRKQLSFHEETGDAVRTENVTLAFQHYKHRSDSDTEDSDDERGKKQQQPPWPSGVHVQVSGPPAGSAGSSIRTSTVMPTSDDSAIFHNNNVEGKRQSNAVYYNPNAHTTTSRHEHGHLIASTSSSFPKHDLPNASMRNGSQDRVDKPRGRVDGSGSQSGCPCVIL